MGWRNLLSVVFSATDYLVVFDRSKGADTFVHVIADETERFHRDHETAKYLLTGHFYCNHEFQARTPVSHLELQQPGRNVLTKDAPTFY